MWLRYQNDLQQVLANTCGCLTAGDRLVVQVPSVQPSMENERYSRFPPPRVPGRGASDLPSKPYHVRFETTSNLAARDGYSTNPLRVGRSSTPLSHERGASATNPRTVSFSPSTKGSPAPSLFNTRSIIDPSATSPRGRAGDAAARGNSYKDVSFSPLPQQSPVRTLSTFSTPPSAATANFTTFQRDKVGPGRGGSLLHSGATAEDDTSTTTSGSYTINPEELRMDGYIGSDVIV